MAIAKLSLTIAVIFILCHSVKWIPNLHEIIMVSIMYIFAFGDSLIYQSDITLHQINLKVLSVFQHIQGKMPLPNNETEIDSVVIMTVNLTYNEIIATNDTMPLQNTDNSTTEDTGEAEETFESEYWPTWVQQVTCISHLSIALNSSVNFWIYYIKRRALNPGTFHIHR